MTQGHEKQNMITTISSQLIKSIICDSIDRTVNRKRELRKSRSTRPRRKADRITWTGEDPEILFKNAACCRTPEAKLKLAEYIAFVYENTTALSSRGLKLIKLPVRYYSEKIATVTVMDVKSGNKRTFFINLGAVRDLVGLQTYRETGEQLLSICLTIIQSILSNQLLHERTRNWNFTIDDNNQLQSGILEYSLDNQTIRKRIDITKEQFWDEFGEFRGERVIAALHCDVQVQDFPNLPPLFEIPAHIPAHPPSRPPQLDRGSSAMQAVALTRGRSFAQVDIRPANTRGKTMGQ